MELFTDGSFIRNEAPAGWGVFSMKRGDNGQTSNIYETCGPVKLQISFDLEQDDSDADSDVEDEDQAPSSFTATKHSNNTGELFAILHALWIIRAEPPGLFIIRFDSFYAAYMSTGVWQPKKENNLIVRKIHNLFMDTLRTHRVRFMHVAGHSTSVGNKEADRLANRGRQLSCPSHITRKPSAKEVMHSWTRHCG